MTLILSNSRITIKITIKQKHVLRNNFNNDQADSASQGQPSGNFGDNICRALAAQDDPPSYYSHYQARMDKSKWNIASFGDEKKDEALIDAEATHHLFLARSSFITYKSMQPETVLAALGESMIVGYETVHVIVGERITLRAYHAKAF